MEKVVDKNNLPCHLRDTKWLAALIMKKYDLHSLGKEVIEEYVRDSLYFNKLRSEYEQKIVKWQINWMLNGGENWIVDPKYGSELVDFSPMYDYAFRKGIVDTLLAIGMDIEAIEEGIEKNADMWQVPIMNTAFNNGFNPVWYRIDSNESKLKEVNPLFKESWLKYRKWKYYQEHKESVDKYGIVTEEMKMTEEVKSLELYLKEQEEARLKEIEDFNNKKDIQEVPEIKVMSQSDFYGLSYEDCLPKKNDSLDKPRGLKKIFKSFFHKNQ